jgi:nicotinamidase-related amidase
MPSRFKPPAATAVQSSVAILIIDMISHFDFEDGEKLFENAIPAAENIAALKTRAKAAGIPVVYVNDNFGVWKELFSDFVGMIGNSERGRKIIDLVGPDADDYYVLKPERSGFYATPLGVLLMSMGVSDIIVTGVTSDIGVLFTAHDAFMRDFNVRVPADCCAAIEKQYHDDALTFIRRVAEADTKPSTEIQFDNPKNMAA